MLFSEEIFSLRKPLDIGGKRLYIFIMLSTLYHEGKAPVNVFRDFSIQRIVDTTNEPECPMRFVCFENVSYEDQLTFFGGYGIL